MFRCDVLKRERVCVCGGGGGVITSAVLTTLLTTFFQSAALQPPHRTETGLLKTLSTDLLLQNAVRLAGGEGGGRWALLILRRKCRRWCALLTGDFVFTGRERSSVMCARRNPVLLTISAAVLSRRTWSVDGLVLPVVDRDVSTVLSTFRSRLPSLRQNHRPPPSPLCRPGHCRP